MEGLGWMSGKGKKGFRGVKSGRFKVEGLRAIRLLRSGRWRVDER